MKLQIVGGPRDGDFELIGDRTTDRELGNRYEINGLIYEITMAKGMPPRLTYRGYEI